MTEVTPEPTEEQRTQRHRGTDRAHGRWHGLPETSVLGAYWRPPPAYLCVLDLEATCDRDQQPRPQEIIEFPVVLVNTATLARDAEFHRYVRPRHHPTLTPFCTELTGITQERIDADGIPLEQCLDEFDAWLVERGLVAADGSGECVEGKEWLFVTSGNWDLQTMLPAQCRGAGLYRRPYFREWCDVRCVCEVALGRRCRRGMPGMLRALRLPLVGRHHSGIDDARNIAAICVALLRVGAPFVPTRSTH